MNTTTMMSADIHPKASKKKRRSKKKTRLTSLKRVSRAKTKRKKPIGLPSLITSTNTDNQTNNGMHLQSQVILPLNGSNVLIKNGINDNKNVLNSHKSLSSHTSSSSSLTSTKSSSTHIVTTSRRKKNKSALLGLDKSKISEQKKQRNNLKKKKLQKRSKYKRFSKNSKLKTKKDIHIDDIDDDVDDIKLDSKTHIIRNCGKHKLNIHIDHTSKIGPLKINGNIHQLSNLKINNILEIISCSNNNNVLTLKISSISLNEGNKWSISINERISEKFKWIRMDQLSLYNINLINPFSLELLQIELSYKNQYISRGYQWKIEQDLYNKVVHLNENIKSRDISCNAYNLNVESCKLLKNSEYVSTGLITRNTSFVFRSRSAWFMFLVQLSAEMWDFSDLGQIHFEKFINGFLKSLMKKWEIKQCKHVYSIVFYARTFYKKKDIDLIKKIQKKKVYMEDSDGRYYQDHYMVVVRNWSENNWTKLSKKLRNAFDRFPILVKWKRKTNYLNNISGIVGNNTNNISGDISVAAEGNILESIQLSINVLDKHYIDRDLHRTGMSITLITAGNGLYYVNKSLAAFTKNRILNNGINCDIVSMAKPPLHPTPMFVYGSPKAFENNKWETLNYDQPAEWIQIRFFEYNPYNEPPVVEPSLLYKKTASFLAIKDLSKTFVPLSLGTDQLQNIVSNTNINNNNDDIDVMNIYLPNYPTKYLQNKEDDYDAQIFNSIPHDDLINNGKSDKPNKSDNIKSTPTTTTNIASRMHSKSSAQILHTLKPPSIQEHSPLSTVSDRSVRSNSISLSSLKHSVTLSTSTSTSISPASPQQANTNTNTNNNNKNQRHSRSKRHSDADIMYLNNDNNVFARMFSDGVDVYDDDEDDMNEDLSTDDIHDVNEKEIVEVFDKNNDDDDDDNNNGNNNDNPNTVIKNAGIDNKLIIIQNPSSAHRNPLQELEQSTPFNEMVIDDHDHVNNINNDILNLSNITSPTGISNHKSPFKRRSKFNNFMSYSDTEIDYDHHYNSKIRKKKVKSNDVNIISHNNSPRSPNIDDIYVKKHVNVNNKQLIHPFIDFDINISSKNLRFGHIYPSSHQYSGFLYPSYIPQWTTFIMPAILPLSNNINFKQDTLERNKNVYKSGWQIGADINNNKLVLEEMILQRLTQDFQIMRVYEHDGTNSNTYNHQTIRALNTQTYIHRIKHIINESNISITRYVDIRLVDKETRILNKHDNQKVNLRVNHYDSLTTFSLPYNYNLWNDHNKIFQNYNIKFAETHQLYNWTKLDQVCGGYSDDIENNLKARRIRFALYNNNINSSNSIQNFIDWFLNMTSLKNITETGIKIRNNNQIYYKPQSFIINNKQYDGIDQSQIGFETLETTNMRIKILLESSYTNSKKRIQTFLILKYNDIYDPHTIFHFEIYWLIATGYQIIKFIENIKKSAYALSLNLITVPSAQPSKIADPFSFTLNVENQYLYKYKSINILIQNALLNKFNFILDTNYPNISLQFMHITGCAIVRWHNKGFIWVPNNSRNTLNNELRLKSIELFRDFRKYYHDVIHVNEIIDKIIINVVDSII